MLHSLKRRTSGPRKPAALPMPVPFGAYPDRRGTAFTFFSRHAARVWLMLFDSATAARPDREIALDPDLHRCGDVWHIHVPGVKAGTFYLYRLDGEPPPGIQQAYDPQQWVLDPYAQAVSGAPRWGDTFGLVAGEVPQNGAKFPKGIVVADDFNWGREQSPQTPLADTILYEVHLRGFTAHPNAGVAAPGTYRGFIEKIPYLKKLGITAVELLPMQEFNEMEYYQANDARQHLRNYWGYSTVNFFAPNARFAQGPAPGAQVREFKELVRALHKAGIEVILDIVFNHTAEGGHGGPVTSFRGIEPSIYYMMNDDGLSHPNYSGCGNTVNCNHPVVRDFIVANLRHWVTRYRVDGFRFDLASILARGQHGEVLANPPVIEAIAEDPVLAGTKLIAEAWDAAGLYQVGSFPSARWSEWNGRYRDDLRTFWRGSRGSLSAFATRLAGSGDLYDRPGQRPQKSINFITSHDGFTLADLVSYNEKHNEANGEHNRDGDNHNHSFNYGVEGPTGHPQIGRIRKRQMKNMIASLMLSQGVPMLLAGDECGRTQQGNNNAYCQDNELAWFDWSLLKTQKDLLAFTRRVIAFRKNHPCLRRNTFLTGCIPENDGADIIWLGADGHEPNWDNAQALGCLLDGRKIFTGAEEDKDHLLLLFNAHEYPVSFQMPAPPAGPWAVALTTQERTPRWLPGQSHIELEDRSITAMASALKPD
jgi:isoamylase